MWVLLVVAAVAAGFVWMRRRPRREVWHEPAVRTSPYATERANKENADRLGAEARTRMALRPQPDYAKEIEAIEEWARKRGTS